MKKLIIVKLVIIYFTFMFMAQEPTSKKFDISKVLDAIYSSDVVTLEQMLKNGLSPNDTSGRETFLYIAVVADKIEVVKLFAKYGADFRDKDVNSLVEAAVVNNNIEMVEFLIKHGAYINNPFKNSYWKAPLVSATVMYNKEMITLLIKNGADVNIEGPALESPLHTVSKDDYCDIMKIFINAGADKEHRDYEGKTPLMYAAENGQVRAVKLLLDEGANINARDNEGKTTLMLACENGHLSTVQLLLDYGADTSIAARGNVDAAGYAGAYVINKLYKKTKNENFENYKSEEEMMKALEKYISEEDKELIFKCGGKAKITF